MIFMHLDLHFVTFATYSVYDVLLNKCVVVFMFARWRLYVFQCYYWSLLDHFWCNISHKQNSFTIVLYFVVFTVITLKFSLDNNYSRMFAQIPLLIAKWW